MDWGTCSKVDLQISRGITAAVLVSTVTVFPRPHNRNIGADGGRYNPGAGVSGVFAMRLVTPGAPIRKRAELSLLGRHIAIKTQQDSKSVIRTRTHGFHRHSLSFCIVNDSIGL
jgi:hypothetical protein